MGRRRSRDPFARQMTSTLFWLFVLGIIGLMVQNWPLILGLAVGYFVLKALGTWMAKQSSRPRVRAAQILPRTRLDAVADTPAPDDVRVEFAPDDPDRKGSV